MHAVENFWDLSEQGHRQGLGAEAKTNSKDLPVETKAKDFNNVLKDPRANDLSSTTPSLSVCSELPICNSLSELTELDILL